MPLTLKDIQQPVAKEMVEFEKKIGREIIQKNIEERCETLTSVYLEQKSCENENLKIQTKVTDQIVRKCLNLKKLAIFSNL